VVGVLPDKGNSGFGNANSQVLVPLSTYNQRFSRTNSAGGQPTVGDVYLQAASASDLNALQDDVITLMMTRHRLTDPSALDFSVQNQADSLASLSSITGTLPLLVGGIGLMNIMLVRVTAPARSACARRWAPGHATS
jgi:putative ABC transport system permease protein